MKRVTRAQLRGQPLDPLCKKAHTTTHEYGLDDNRVFCFGWICRENDEPEALCEACGAFFRNMKPLEDGNGKYMQLLQRSDLLG